MRRKSFASARLQRAALAPVLALVLFGAQVMAGAATGFTAPALAAASKAQPNRFDPRSHAASVLHRPNTSASIKAGAPGPYEPPRKMSVPMKPATVALDPVQGAHFLGSDGVFEFDVPAGAVTTGASLPTWHGGRWPASWEAPAILGSRPDWGS